MKPHRRNHLPARFLARREGVAAIEFAILFPVYLLLFMGMVAYGIYFGAAHSVQQLAADAARASVAGLDESDRKAIATSFIERNAAGYLLVDPARLTAEVADSAADGTQFDVIVIYDASQLPIWNLFGGIAMPSETISRRSTIRIGGI